MQASEEPRCEEAASNPPGLPSRRLVPGASGRANGRFLARPTSLGAPVLQVQRWNHDHVQGRRGDDAAEDDDRHGLLDLLARLAGAERERNEADAGDERRHKDRAEALYRSLDDGVAEPDAFLLYEVAVVADEHDAVAGGNAEECDEPDEGGDRQRPAGDEHHDHATDHRERQVRHDERRQARGAEREIEQEENAADGGAGEQRDLTCRSLLGLELPSVLDEVALRQRDPSRDRLTDVSDHASKVSACDVGLNDDPSLHVLAVDRVWPRVDPDLSDLRNGHARTSWRVDEGAADRLDRLARRVVQAHQDAVAPLLLQHPRDDEAAKAHLRPPDDALGAKPARSRRTPGNVDLHLRYADLGLDEEV